MDMLGTQQRDRPVPCKPGEIARKSIWIRRDRQKRAGHSRWDEWDVDFENRPTPDEAVQLISLRSRFRLPTGNSSVIDGQFMGSAKNVSFQVIEGVDKGRRFANLELPITIGREDGNVIRLADDRVSRFHVKIQEDQGQLVLMDLDSTNGTRVNGETVQLRLLRPGDRISVGRSTLVYGTAEQIRSLFKPAEQDPSDATVGPDAAAGSDAEVVIEEEDSFDFGPEGPLDLFTTEPPALPSRLSPAQAARLAEVIEYLHRALAEATGDVQIPLQATEARLPLASWQQVQAVLTILSRYCRQISNPDGDDS